MDEYVSILEAARRCGISDKTIRRAIHAGKLAARYPKPNRAEVAITDLQAWRDLAGDTTELRLAAMEQRIADLERQVTHLTSQLSERAPARTPRKPAQVETDVPAPASWALLQEFADRHGMSRNEAESRFKSGMIAAQRRPWPGYKREMIALGPRGQHDFWIQFHTTTGFQACNDCPHAEKEKNDGRPE